MRNDIIKKVVIAVLAVVAILVILFIGKEIAVRFFGVKLPALSKITSVEAVKIDIPLDSNTNYKHITTDKYIYFVTTDRIYIANANGKEEKTLSISIENPHVLSAGEYVVVGDIGKNRIYLIKNTEIVKEIQTRRAIKNISVNESGYSVAVTEGDMHKRDVTLYNEKGEELFVWTSGSKLVFDAVIANNNKNIIISSMDTQKKSANTTLHFYNISKEEPIATVNYDNEIIADLAIGGNYVYCIGESVTDIYTVNGDKNGEISYKDKNILSYDITEKCIILTFKEGTVSDKRYSLGIYKENGSISATYEHDCISKTLDATNNHIILVREGLICVLDYNGREVKLIDPDIDVDDALFIGNTKKTVGFTVNGAYIIEI